MLPNDLWQYHLLSRPALRKILIIAGGKGEELLGVHLGSWWGAMLACHADSSVGICPCLVVHGTTELGAGSCL